MHNAEFAKLIAAYHVRTFVKPGITGLAQVQLPADEDYDDVQRKVSCDLCYIRELSPWLDMRILIATAMKVAGVPLHMTGQILGLPGCPEIELEPESVAIVTLAS